jgi:hypothetical protein
MAAKCTVFDTALMQVKPKHNKGWQLRANAAIRRQEYSASDSFDSWRMISIIARYGIGQK